MIEEHQKELREDYHRKLRSWLEEKPTNPFPETDAGEFPGFSTPESIRDSLTICGLQDEFTGIDPVGDVCIALATTRKERDEFRSILENPDRIDVMVKDQKIGTAEFQHWIVRAIAHGLGGILAHTSDAFFVVNDPEHGRIRVTITREDG